MGQLPRRCRARGSRLRAKLSMGAYPGYARMPSHSPHRFDDDGEEVEQNLGEFSAVFERGCGHIDASTCLEDLLSACRRDGIDVRFDQRALAFELSPDHSKCSGVVMEGGDVMHAGDQAITHNLSSCGAAPHHPADPLRTPASAHLLLCTAHQSLNPNPIPPQPHPTISQPRPIRTPSYNTSTPSQPTLPVFGRRRGGGERGGPLVQSAERHRFSRADDIG